MRRGRSVSAAQTKPHSNIMHSSRKALVAAIAGVSLWLSASAPAVAAEAGLIGKRHAGADFTYDHFSGASVDKAFGAAAEVNLPLATAYDLNVRYGYTDATGDNYDALEKRLGVSLLTHRLTEWGTAYFGGTLGHAWRSTDALGIGTRDNSAFWGARAGYEVPVGRHAAIDAGIGYTDSFERANTSAQVLSYGVSANRWFSSDLAGVLGVTYRQIKAAPDSILYRAGLRWAF